MMVDGSASSCLAVRVQKARVVEMHGEAVANDTARGAEMVSRSVSMPACQR